MSGDTGVVARSVGGRDGVCKSSDLRWEAFEFKIGYIGASPAVVNMK